METQLSRGNPRYTAELRALAEQIQSIIATQIRHYNSYLELAERHKQALIRHDFEGIQSILVETEKMTVTLRNWEEKRLKTARTLLKLAGKPVPAPEEPIKADLIASCVPSEIGDAILEQRTELRDLLTRVKAALRVNHALTENGRKIIHSTVAIITSVAGRNKEQQKTYGQKGQAQRGETQIRQLVNCKA